MWAAAYGQIFFSLSIGFGIMITYSSYVHKHTDMPGSGLVVGFDAPDVPEFGAAAEQAVVRIVREALTNCIRHAGGAEVDLEIVERNAEVQVRVRSRGGVASAAAAHGGEGWGLQMLRERVGALGGFFTAGPAPDGWSVEGRLPLEVRV